SVWVPLLDGTERLGVLRYVFPARENLGDPLLDECALVASLVAELVVVRTQYGDNIERTKRRLPMTLAAELQWRVLPPPTLITKRVAISAVLAPAHTVAGDSFDYAINQDSCHV